MTEEQMKAFANWADSELSEMLTNLDVDTDSFVESKANEHLQKVMDALVDLRNGKVPEMD